jgi:hypothetical protein
VLTRTTFWLWIAANMSSLLRSAENMRSNAGTERTA